MNAESFTFNQQRVVNAYSKESHLQKPEEIVLSHLSRQLPEFSMLDLGVGAGRTTLHFAKWVKEYEGVDISPNMVKACLARFSEYPMALKFKQGDAADLSWIEASSKDFVLFSYNGIDYVNHENRLKVFAEIDRVLKKKGYFLFSSHNILSAKKQFAFRSQWTRNPVVLMKKLKFWFDIKRKNRRKSSLDKIMTFPYYLFNDGAYQFSLETYYISPEEQLKQLEPYFNHIKAFSISDGQIIQQDKLQSNDESWIYYLCQKK